MLKLSACVLLLAATVQGRVVLTDLHYTTRVVPARWSPKVNALVLDQALDCQYHYSVARANEVRARAHAPGWRSRARAVPLTTKRAPIASPSFCARRLPTSCQSLSS